MNIYSSLNDTINNLIRQFEVIPAVRKKILTEISQYIETKVGKEKKVNLVFICTHNSRRSHIAQVWAQTAASYYRVANVECYSGGTEATAFNPRAVNAMEHAGFKIRMTRESNNPLYEVFYADDYPPVKAFSKKYDDAFNPQKEFSAIMTCAHADEHCPVVTGAEARISVPFDDPKDFDGTPQESAAYQERVMQIGREVFFAFSQIKLP